MASQGKFGYINCDVKETMLDQLCVAVSRYANAAGQLCEFVGQHARFEEAEANVHAQAWLVRGIRAEYNEHKRAHGC